MQLYDRFIATDRGNVQGLFYSYETSIKGAVLFATLGRRDDAIATFVKTIDGLQRLIDQGLVNADLVRRLADYCGRVGDLFAALDPRTRVLQARERASLEKAGYWYRRSHQFWQELAQDGWNRSGRLLDPDDTSAKIALIDAALRRARH
jgi:hypothetical protein